MVILFIWIQKEEKMAGKPGKGKSRRGLHNNNNNNNVASNNSSNSLEHIAAKSNVEEGTSEHAEAELITSTNPSEVKEHETPNADTQQKQGQPHVLYYA